MAGHSKWSNIKRHKAKEDAKKSKVFGKHSRAITVAARQGGTDVEFNPTLKMEIDRAKAVNMPNDNIERAIKAAADAQSGVGYDEVMYEGYGPSGVAVMVQTLTNNRNRTAANVRHAFDKCGGNLGQSGCVSFMFDRKGIVAIERKEGIDEDELMMQAIELGAEDVLVEEEGYEIITSPEDFNGVRDGLKEEGYEFVMAELTYIPQNTVSLESEEDIKNMENLIDMLEDNDDVQEVYHNWEMEE